ncbi:serine/threonine-protein kinase [Laspinema olomoucense]|uniref:Serine/threonine-protein kinase n=1 Tax=Laspinema olomoucense D3b TaxID=2953688 RepID=A0ABT2N8A5_9CYAN|nr:serine/threonine-protein kinase [Laspinema sp. D3b]MCT7978922.1 serine/threonine-protein kinase [Laspinema sp. D3b]
MSLELGFEDDADEDEKYLGLAMELAEDSLRQYLENRQTLPQEEVRNIVIQIASLLVFIQSRNIVHHNLKPPNILKVRQVWKVADFGLSRMLTQGTSTKTSPSQQIGAFAYQPPESYQGEIHPAWDVWSLGILLQEMLTGTHPFAATTIPELMMKVMTQEPEFPQGLSREFVDILNGCLAKNPRQRWTAQQVLDAVQPSSSNRGNTLQSIEGLDLSSERPGINYYKLRDLLAAKQWEEADLETAKRMWEVMGRSDKEWLRSEDIERFPCKDLKIIDKLWVHYSQGKYGFSVQKKIWLECGSPTFPIFDNDNWERFCDRVGWSSAPEWIDVDEALSPSLPFMSYIGYGEGWPYRVSLALLARGDL